MTKADRQELALRRQAMADAIAGLDRIIAEREAELLGTRAVRTILFAAEIATIARAVNAAAGPQDPAAQDWGF